MNTSIGSSWSVALASLRLDADADLCALAPALRRAAFTPVLGALSPLDGGHAPWTQALLFADPFLVPSGHELYLFFEVLGPHSKGLGALGAAVAPFSPDADSLAPPPAAWRWASGASSRPCSTRRTSRSSSTTTRGT